MKDKCEFQSYESEVDGASVRFLSRKKQGSVSQVAETLDTTHY